MAKQQLLESITYKSNSQSISRRDIYSIKDKTIKLEVKSDSYAEQCFARAFVFRDDKWEPVYNIPHSLMKTPEGLAYMANYKKEPSVAEAEFKADIEKLKEYTEKILF